MGDEDAELKDVLVRSLNENGILPRIQAQLRAAVFVALEKHNFDEFLTPPNDILRSFMRTEDGLLVASLIVDFLSQMNLDNTLEVLKSEAELDQNLLLDRERISSQLCGTPLEKGKPLIVQLVSGYRCSGYQRPARSPTERQSASSNKFNRPTLNGPSGKSSLIPFNEKESFAAVDTCSDGSSHHTITEGSKGERNGESQASNVSKGSSGDKKRPATGLQQQTINSNKEKASISSDDPMDPETYQDDFTSPKSQKASASLDSTNTANSCHHLPDATNFRIRRQESPSSLPPRAGSASPLTCKSSSVIRVYVRNRHGRNASTEEPSSDIDDDGDGEIIEECLSVTLDPSSASVERNAEASKHQKSHSAVGVDEEVTLDETIDSEGSLIMDHAEDVLPAITKAIGPSHKANSNKMEDSVATTTFSSL